MGLQHYGPRGRSGLQVLIAVVTCNYVRHPGGMRNRTQAFQDEEHSFVASSDHWAEL